MANLWIKKVKLKWIFCLVISFKNSKINLNWRLPTICNYNIKFYNLVNANYGEKENLPTVFQIKTKCGEIFTNPKCC